MAFKTPPDLSASVLLHVLKIFREQTGESLTPRQVAEALHDRGQYWLEDWWYETRFGELMDALLHDLAELGWLVAEQGDDSPCYRIADAPPHNPPPPKVPSADSGGDQPGDGSGMAEVLAHPILFAYPQDEFEQALARALEPHS